MKEPRQTDSSRPWKILAVTSFAVFASALDTTILYVAFPDIQKTFSDVSRADLSWAINAYTIVFAALLVPAGRLADRVGRRKVFFAGVVIFTVSSALAGSAPSAATLIGARVIQAVGAAALLPSSLALVLGEFPREKRATAVGIWGAVGALAAATGPTLGALIIDAASWRLAFFVNLPIGALTIFLGSRLIRESKDPDAAQRQDLLGIPLLIAGVGALALGIVQSDEWGWAGTRTLAAFAVSAVILPLFILRSATYHSPALDLTLFRNRNFRMANLATASFGIAFAAMFLGTVLFLTNVWQYSILEAGLLIAPGPFIAGVVAGPAGRAADRIGHRPMLVAGGLIFAAANVWRVLGTDLEREVWNLWIPSLILTGIGVGLTLPTLSSAAVHGLAPNRFAVGSAVNQTVRQLGSVLGVALVIALLGSPNPADLLEAF
ncbi:MAG TPA: DHA2 family efflux MFS transporter permease subunit, partial [Dehalococcoidia bacterium]|nr:DHA2 family efflux MFS transporter permease subunit [Dehalococcoidia bacterium]